MPEQARSTHSILKVSCQCPGAIHHRIYPIFPCPDWSDLFSRQEDNIKQTAVLCWCSIYCIFWHRPTNVYQCTQDKYYSMLGSLLSILKNNSIKRERERAGWRKRSKWPGADSNPGISPCHQLTETKPAGVINHLVEGSWAKPWAEPPQPKNKRVEYQCTNNIQMILPRGKLVHFQIPAMPRIFLCFLPPPLLCHPLPLTSHQKIHLPHRWVTGVGCTLSLLRRFLNPCQAEPCWAEPRKTQRRYECDFFFPDTLLVIFNTSTLVKAKLLACTRTTRKYKNTCGNKTNKTLKQATNTCLLFSSGPPVFWTGSWDCPVCETHFRWAALCL